jgi:hypothetical protein
VSTLAGYLSNCKKRGKKDIYLHLVILYIAIGRISAQIIDYEHK